MTFCSRVGGSTGVSGGSEFGSAMRSVLNEVAKEGSAAGAGPPSRHSQVWVCDVCVMCACDV